jgi:hypothetical protein
MAIREHALFRRLDTPAKDSAQGGCYITHETGPCVDTGVLVEFEGTLTLSLGAIKELAEVAGFSVNEEAEQIERDIANLEEENARLREQLAEAKDALKSVGVAIAAAANVKAAK